MGDKGFPGTQGYGDEAERLAAQYEGVDFASIYRDVAHLIPAAPRLVLDIGAGSGRDAASLAALGHSVVAVEPTPAMREIGRKLHAESAIAWIDDGLPGLDAVRARRERYAFVMLSAVWMHLDAHEREAAMPIVAGLLDDDGRIFLSLRHGPVPAGRRMFDVSAVETITLAGMNGLTLAHYREQPDMLGRPEVRWSFLVFERR